MDFWVVFLPLILMLVVIIGAMHDARVKRRKRAAYLQTYPTLAALQATIDKAKYRAILDNRGLAHATRQLMRDHPGIRLTEAAEITKAL